MSLRMSRLCMLIDNVIKGPDGHDYVAINPQT